MVAQAALTDAIAAHCGDASVTCVCVTAPTDGRSVDCAAQKFPKEQVSSDVTPAQKMGDLSRRARMPARPRIRSVYAMEVI